MAKAKRKPGKRTATGQLSRSKAAKADRAATEQRTAFEDGPMQTVLKARRRHKATFREPHDPARYRRKDAAPVTRDEARALADQGSVLGRMKAAGHITPEEVAAGADYCQRYITYAALNGLPRPTPQGAAYGEVRGASRPERIRAAIAAKAAHDTDQRILRHCSAGVVWAIKRACVLDEAAPPHLVSEGLKALIANGR